MSRFFINEESIGEKHITITGEDVNHIKNVLRLKIGENIILCDGKGTDYVVRIEKIDQGSIATAITDVQTNKNESPLEVTLFQGIPKSDKMDFIIQKSIELGVSKVVPVSTERTVVKIDGLKDAQKKVERWQRISLEAAKQCNRGVIPQVGMPVSFNDTLKSIQQYDLGIIPYEKEGEGRLRNLISGRDFKKVAVMIGPEGGFSEKEVGKAMSSGVKPATLGPRILRTETAGIAVISILMYELGDVG